jgi:hypothetical protein
MIFHPTCFSSNDIHKRLGKFDTNFRIAAEYEFIIRCRKAGEEFHGIRTVLAIFSEEGYSLQHKFRSVIEAARVHIKYTNSISV